MSHSDVFDNHFRAFCHYYHELATLKEKLADKFRQILKR